MQTNRLHLFLLTFALTFSRYVAYGFRYFPQLDDYIQYHNYAAFDGSLAASVERLGLLAARPFAGLTDISLWSFLFPSLLSVLLLSALYALSGVLLRQLFQVHFPVSPLFLVLFALLPVGMEGLYWMSAATRIVPALFFATLAACFLQDFLQGEKKCRLPLSMAAFFLCCGFYEQGLVFGITLLALVGLLHFPKVGLRSLWALGAVPVAGALLFLTSLVKNSPLYADRAEILLPFSSYYWGDFFPTVGKQIVAAFVNGTYSTFFHGLRRAPQILWEDGLFWILPLFALLCYGLWRSFSPSGEEGRRTLAPFVVGFLLALAPVTPFFVLGNPWFSLRGTVLSFTGLALMGDSLCLRFCKRRQILALGTAFLAFLFCVASVSELHDYRQTSLDDAKAGQALAAVTGAPTEVIGIIGMEPTYLKEQSFLYHEHIHGVTESAWALTGAVRYFANRKDTPLFVPLPLSAPYYAPWNKGERVLTDFDRLFFYDHEGGTLAEVQATATGSDTYAIANGPVLVATAYEEDGKGYFATS